MQNCIDIIVKKKLFSDFVVDGNLEGKEWPLAISNFQKYVDTYVCICLYPYSRKNKNDLLLT